MPFEIRGHICAIPLVVAASERLLTDEKKNAQAKDVSIAGKIHLLILEAFPRNGCWKIDSIRVRVASRFLPRWSISFGQVLFLFGDLPPLHALQSGRNGSVSSSNGGN